MKLKKDEIHTKLCGSNPYEDITNRPCNYKQNVLPEFFETEIERIKPKVIVEVGSWHGSSAIEMAQILKKLNMTTSCIICVDTWLGSPEHWNNNNSYWNLGEFKNGRPTLYEQFLSNVISAECTECIIPFPQTSLNAYYILKKLEIVPQLVYIDGAHDYQTAYQDICDYYELLDDDGLLIGDDYPRSSGVFQAVADFMNQSEVNAQKMPKSKFIIRK